VNFKKETLEVCNTLELLNERIKSNHWRL
jgi:hypothetical protein